MTADTMMTPDALSERLAALRARRRALTAVTWGTEDAGWRQRMEDLIAWDRVPALSPLRGIPDSATVDGALAALQGFEDALAQAESLDLPEPARHPLLPPQAPVLRRFAGWFEGNEAKAFPDPIRPAQSPRDDAVVQTMPDQVWDVALSRSLAGRQSTRETKEKTRSTRPIWLALGACLLVAVAAVLFAVWSQQKTANDVEIVRDEAETEAAELRAQVETASKTLATERAARNEADARVTELETQLADAKAAIADAEARAPSDEVLAARNAQLTEELAEARAALAAVGTELAPDTGPRPTSGPSHLIDAARVNARSGPGIQNPVVTRLTRDTPLSLVEETNGWGRFRVLDGDAAGEDVWVSIRLTRSAP